MVRKYIIYAIFQLIVIKGVYYHISKNKELSIRNDHTEDLGEGGNPIFAYARSTIFGQQMGKDGQDVFRIKGIFFAHFIPLK